MILNMRLYMTPNVRIYMTANVRRYMMPIVRIYMTTNVRPRLRMCSRIVECPAFPVSHLNPIFPYFFIGFLTIIYKKPYKKQGFLIQFAKLDRFPASTQNSSKNLFGHFRPFFTIILFFWPFQIVDLPQNINFHPTKNSGSPFFATKLHFFSPTSTTHFFQFCGFPDLRNSV